MLQVLTIPYPDMVGVGRWGLVLVFLRVAALVGVYRLAGSALKARGLLLQVVAVALIDTAIAGNIRSAIMQAVVTESLSFPAITLAVELLGSLGLAAIIVVSQRTTDNNTAVVLSVIAAAAALVFGIGPLGRTFVQRYESLEMPEVHKQPYGIDILAWSYPTYLETVLAVLVVAWLILPRLSRRSGVNLLQFCLVILLLRGTLVMQMLFPWLMRGPTATAALSVSQFFLQDLLMGALVWWSAWRLGDVRAEIVDRVQRHRRRQIRETERP